MVDRRQSSLDPVWLHAPAKLNLFLELLGKRPDGFHELETVMVAVTIQDTLVFTPTEDGSISLQLDFSLDDRHHSRNTNQDKPGRHRSGAGHEQQNETVLDPNRTNEDPTGTTTSESIVNAPDIPTGSDNIVVRALESLRQQWQTPFGAKVRLIKRIPSQAGLGGASSDAATALLLANRAWQLNLPLPQLAEFAGSLGSDIPFFFGTGAAVCRGRGEIIEPIEVTGGPIHFVVVKPPIGLPTPDVFRVCSIPSQPTTGNEVIAALRDGKAAAIADHLHNRLQPAASQLTHWIDELADHFESMKCLGHCMSGSGSSYFGIFHHRRQALRAANELRQRECGQVFATQTTRLMHKGHPYRTTS